MDRENTRPWVATMPCAALGNGVGFQHSQTVFCVSQLPTMPCIPNIFRKGCCYKSVHQTLRQTQKDPDPEASPLSSSEEGGREGRRGQPVLGLPPPRHCPPLPLPSSSRAPLLPPDHPSIQLESSGLFLPQGFPKVGTSQPSTRREGLHLLRTGSQGGRSDPRSQVVGHPVD